MEGQLQLRRVGHGNEHQHEQEHEHEHERGTEWKDLPLEGSPHHKCKDLNSYKIMSGQAAAAAQGRLDKGGAAATSTAVGGRSRISQRDADAIERKLK